jgi:hypothetical protein
MGGFELNLRCQLDCKSQIDKLHEKMTSKCHPLFMPTLVNSQLMCACFFLLQRLISV